MPAKTQAEMQPEPHKQTLAGSRTVFPSTSKSAMAETCQYSHTSATGPSPGMEEA